MNKQLPAVWKSSGMQPALVLSRVFSFVLVLLVVVLAVEAIIGCFFLQPSIVVCNVILVLYLTWAYGGTVIDNALSFKLIQHLQARNYAAMEMAYKRAAKLWRALHFREGRQFGLVCSNMALMQMLQGKYDDAEPNLRQAIKLIESDKRLRNHYIFSIPLTNLAAVCASRKDYAESETLAKKALTVAESGNSNKTSAAAFPLIVLGEVYLEQGRLDDAEKCLSRANDLLVSAEPPFLILRESVESSKVSCQVGLAILRGAQERMKDCVELTANLVDYLSQDNRFLAIHAIKGISELAETLIVHNQPKLAESLMEHAYAVAVHQPDHPDAALLQITYAKLLSTTDRAQEIPDMRRWVRPVLMDIPMIGQRD
jgi:tetratricopeptide (TPR) repeat protein